MLNAEDLVSREAVAKALNDIDSRVKAVSVRDGDLDSIKSRQTEMVDDLKLINKRLAELNVSSVAAVTTDERKLRSYVEADGVRLVGGIDARVREYVPGLLDDVKAANEWQRDLQKIWQDRNLIRCAIDPRGQRESSVTPIMDERLRRHFERAPEVLKRAPAWGEFVKRSFVNSSTAGSNWIIAAGLPEVARDPRLRSDLEKRFRVKPMATATETLPFMTTGLRPRKKGAATTDDPAAFTSTSVVTAARTLSAVGMYARAQVDRDAAEDAIIAVLPFINEELVNALRDGFEDCLINGDTAATHGDTGLASWDIRTRWGTSPPLGGSDDHRRTFMGFRQNALDISGASGDGSSAETYAGMLGWRAKLAAPMGVLADLLHVVSTEWMLLKLMPMTEFKTVDVAGPSVASNVNGVIAKVGGVDVMMSEYMPGAELTGAGIYDNSTKTYTGALTISTGRYWVTERQGQVVEIDTDIIRDLYNIVAKNRKGLFDMDAGAKKNLYYAYKLTAS